MYQNFKDQYIFIVHRVTSSGKFNIFWRRHRQRYRSEYTKRAISCEKVRFFQRACYVCPRPLRLWRGYWIDHQVTVNRCCFTSNVFFVWCRAFFNIEWVLVDGSVELWLFVRKCFETSTDFPSITSAKKTTTLSQGADHIDSQ